MDEFGPMVLLVEPDDSVRATARAALAESGFEVHAVGDPNAVHEAIYENPPQCLVLAHGLATSHGIPLLVDLKSDNVYGHLPAVILVNESTLALGIEWHLIPADDYVRRPLDPGELVSRVRLCLARSHRDMNANPLTGLPGNLTIMKEAERRLAAGLTFAMTYVDVDHFKAFNDKYGFSRGDEVLRMIGRLLVNAIRGINHPDTYIGHIGGDDFIFMTPVDVVEETCQGIIANFDLIVPNFYDEPDRARGCIESVDRQGNPKTFPLMSLSLAIIDTEASRIEHMADLSARAAEVKHFAKELEGSNYLIDRRN